jgi:peptide/nickel transport system substrate-binding protein
MTKPRAVWALLISLTLLATSCAGPAPSTPGAPPVQSGQSASTGQAGQPNQARPATPKRITIAISGNPNTLNNSVARAGSGGVAGVDALEEMVSAGLTVLDDNGRRRPQLAESVPTVESGLWKLMPDGRMETTWRLKNNVKWHDGTPVTADDLVFTVNVGRDRDLPALGNAGYNSLESVQATDSRTVVATWSRPFIQADGLFTYDFALPLPRHLLEKPYLEDKGSFLNVPYWTSEFVGNGAYRVRDWSEGSHMIMVANDQYVLGRPKIDDIEVRFIRDPQTLIANILAGEVVLTMGRGLSLEQAVQVRDQWGTNGKLGVILSSWIAAYPQMQNPNPVHIADVRFRRALLHAINRQDLVESLQAGQSAVAHSYLSPREGEYADIERSIVKYEYDPRRAGEILEGMGFTRAAEGWRDASGQRVQVEIRTTGGDDLQEKTMLSISDFWTRLGIQVESVVVPQQRAQDREYRANFPGFEEVRQPNDLTPGALTRYHGSEASLPENSYRGSNRMRYRSPELDSLIDRFYATVPQIERTRVLGEITRHMTDQVIPLGMFYNAQPTMIGARLVNVGPGGAAVPPSWNVHEWDLR